MGADGGEVGGRVGGRGHRRRGGRGLGSVGRLGEARGVGVVERAHLGLGDLLAGHEGGGGEVHVADHHAGGNVVAATRLLEERRQLGVGRLDLGLEGGVVRGGRGEGPGGVRAFQLVLDLGGEHVAGAGEEGLDLVGADVVAENAADVGLRDATRVGLQVVAEGGVGLGVELAVLAGEHAEPLDLLLELGIGGGREVPGVGEVEGGGALEGVVLDLGAVQLAEGPDPEVGAEAGVAHQALLVGLEAQVVAEELAVDDLAVSAADAGGGADGEDEGNDDDAQQHREHRPEVVLKVFLDPGNHGGKGGKLGRPMRVARANWSPGGGLGGAGPRVAA